MIPEYELVRPCEEYLGDAYAYRDEFILAGSEFHGDGGVYHFDDLHDWIAYNRRLENHEVAESAWTEYAQYLYVRREDAHIIGMINWRDTDNAGLLENAGQIGYSVRPSERNKGHAKQMLKLVAAMLFGRGWDTILLTCDRTNEASKRTILACGGAYQRESGNMEVYAIERN